MTMGCSESVEMREVHVNSATTESHIILSAHTTREESFGLSDFLVPRESDQGWVFLVPRESDQSWFT